VGNNNTQTGSNTIAGHDVFTAPAASAASSGSNTDDAKELAVVDAAKAARAAQTKWADIVPLPDSAPRIRVVNFVSLVYVNDATAQDVIAEMRRVDRRLEGLEMESFGFLSAAESAGVPALFLKGMSDAGCHVEGAPEGGVRDAHRDRAASASALAAFFFLARKAWVGVFSPGGGVGGTVAPSHAGVAAAPGEGAAAASATVDAVPHAKRHVDVLIYCAKSAELSAVLHTFPRAVKAWLPADLLKLTTPTPDYFEDFVFHDATLSCASFRGAEPWSLQLAFFSPNAAGGIVTANALSRYFDVRGKPGLVIMPGMTAAYTRSTADGNRLGDVLVARYATEHMLDAKASSPSAPPALSTPASTIEANKRIVHRVEEVLVREAADSSGDSEWKRIWQAVRG
jgi:nucleoside phosphorylase